MDLRLSSFTLMYKNIASNLYPSLSSPSLQPATSNDNGPKYLLSARPQLSTLSALISVPPSLQTSLFTGPSHSFLHHPLTPHFLQVAEASDLRRPVQPFPSSVQRLTQHTQPPASPASAPPRPPTDTFPSPLPALLPLFCMYRIPTLSSAGSITPDSIFSHTASATLVKA